VSSIYYSPFMSQSRIEMVQKCIEVLNNDQKVIYILPSREAMFDVRNIFMSLYGGIVNSYIFGFDDFEKLLCSGETNFDNLLNSNSIGVIIRSLLAGIPEDAYYARVKSKSGFAKAVYGCIKRLKRLDISPDDFLRKSQKLDSALRLKCSVVADIYKQYESYKSEKSLYDIDDISIKACGVIKDNPLLSETGIIIIDGFINIDPINKKLMQVIKQNHPHIQILGNFPCKNVHNSQFIMDEAIGDLLELGLYMDSRAFGELPEVNPLIKSIADNLYSGEKIINEAPLGVRILNSPCIEHEVRTAARIIKEKLVLQKAEPEDIAVFIKSMDEYEEAVLDVFKELGIPVRFVEERSLLSLPLVKDYTCLIAYHLEDRRKEALISLCSSKYLLPKALLERLNYETECLRKLSHRVADTADPRNFCEMLCRELDLDEELKYISSDLENYLDLIIGVELEDIEGTVSFIERLYSILGRIDIRANITSLYNKRLIDGEEFASGMKAAALIEGILKELMDISDKHATENNNNWVSELYREMLDILSSTTISQRTMNLGGVKVLDPDLARGQVYDTVFLLGVNEGVFPGGLSANPLFNIIEDDQLFKHGINLRNRLWELEREKLRFNMCIGSAGKELYVSYRTSDEEGGYMIKSPFVDELEALFDKDVLDHVIAPVVYMRDRFSFGHEPASVSEAIRKLSETIWNRHGAGIEEQSYIHSLYKKETVREKLDLMNHSAMIEFSRMANPYFDAYDGIMSNPNLAQKDAAYGFSASQINSYMMCPFKYFSERVLGLSELEEDEVLGAKNIGTFYHEILKDYYSDNDDFGTYNEERLKRIFNNKSAALNDGSIPTALFDCIKMEQWLIISNFVRHDASNLRHYHEVTGFRIKPVLLEHPFKEADRFAGYTMRGVADRVDLELTEDGAYTGRFIIYDYKKSGIKSLKECVEGKDFQLPIYYIAISSYLEKEFGISEPQCLALIYYSIQKLERKGIIRSEAKPYLYESRKGPRDLVGRRNMDVLIDWVAENTDEKVIEIKKGIFNLPNVCPTDGTPWGCLYKPICRYDRYRVALKRKAGEK